MKKYIAFLAFFLTLKAYPQTNNFQMPKIVPSSPEASALYKVSDIPMDYMSGSANIDIPIYTIKDGNISVPISVSYNTSGIKVQDVAGLVGLGWNLNYGGIITVRGESSQPGLQVLKSDFKQSSDITTGDPTMALAFSGRVVAGVQEKQNPQYYYSFGNYSGSFFYDINGQLCINSSKQSLAITSLKNGLNDIIGFVVTTPEGLQYTFKDLEYSSSSASNWSRTSAYSITSILDLNGNRTVTFKYKLISYNQTVESQNLQYIPLQHPAINVQACPTCTMVPFSSSSSVNVVQTGVLQIDSIKFSSGYVKFLSSSDRLDINPTRITQISVFNSSNVAVTKAVFNQSYFGLSAANYRLKLDAVTFLKSDGTTGENYGFSYNMSFTPAYKRSDGHICTGADYWGYYNGKESNAGLIPKDAINPADFTSYTVPATFLGDRKADSLYTQAFILNKITYPTGGAVQFFYESNYVSGFILGSVVGGIRIKKISYYDNSVSGPSYSKYYKYINGAIPLSLTNNLYSYDKNKILLCRSSCYAGPNGPTVSNPTRNVYSDPIGTLAYLIINPFYSQVEEYAMDGSFLNQKTVYYYDTVNQYWTQPMWFPEYGNYYVTEKSWLKGQLLKKTEYYTVDQFKNYKIVKKEENTYTDSQETQPLMGVHVVKRGGYDIIGGDYCDVFVCNPSVPSDELIQFQYFDAKGDHASRALTNRKTVDYAASDSLVTNVNYTYQVANNNYFNTNNYFYWLSQSSTVSSQGKTLDSYFWCPIAGKATFTIRGLPSVDAPSGTAIDSLTVRNIISPVLQEQHFTNGVNQYGKRTNYALWPGSSGSLILPRTYQYQQGTNALENRIDYLKYDNYGNPLTISKDLGPPSSYIWGYNNNYPVAQITNATVNDVFYDSFEEGDGNISNDAKTGHYSHSGSYSKVLTGLDNGQYTYSYWQKASGVWTLNSTIVTVAANTFTISLNAQVDDIKFYPLNAKMQTFTFDPLIGMTSSTDAKGNIHYFEYDSFNRPMNIKDYLGNIIKNVQYNYNPLLSLSDYANVAAFRAFTKNDCQTGYHGSVVNYNVPSRKYYAATQTAADALAQSDITANGQAYANTNGTCIINNPVITSGNFAGPFSASLTFTSIPNCASTLISYVNVGGINGQTVPPGSIAGTCSSPITVTVPAAPGTYNFTITCYSAAYPLGVTSAPVSVYIPF